MRADIQVLRAFAVLTVVLYHFKAPASTGGFIGVDVFFVISGFLVGGALMGEIRDHGKIDLMRFFARRARRILPLATVVIAVVAVASYVVLSPLRLRLWESAWETSSVAKDGLASLLYVPNLWFMAQGNDYLADDSTSPYLHFWSLGVEEQFYVATPLALLLVWALVRRRYAVLVVSVGVLSAASLAFSLLAVGDQPVTAFFHPFSRFWELGAGLLAAVLVRSGKSRLVPWASHALIGVSLAALCAVFVALDRPSVWPAPSTVAVVGLVCVLLWAGSLTEDWGKATILRPLVLLGDRSYAVYLWHWPVYVLAGLYVERGLRAWETIVIAVGVLVISELSFRLIESPPRRWAVVTARDLRKVFLATGAAFLGALAALSVVAAAAQADARDGTTDIAAPPFRVPGEFPGPTATHEPTPRVAAPELTLYLPSNLRPALAAVAEDIPISYGDGCHRAVGVRTDPIPDCSYGEGPTTVVLYGDSHAAQWLPALLQLADTGEIRVVSLTASSCRPFATDTDDAVEHANCDVWRAAALDRISREKPAAVFVSFLVNGSGSSDESIVEGLDQAVSDLRGVVPSGGRLIWVSDTPYWPGSPAECAAGSPQDLSACMGPVDDLLRRPLLSSLGDLAARRGVAVLDMRPLYCSDEVCGPVVGDIFAYRDHHHITATFARSLAPIFEKWLGTAPAA